MSCILSPGFTDLAGLSLEDHITLTVIEKYLDFKVNYMVYNHCFYLKNNSNWLLCLK